MPRLWGRVGPAPTVVPEEGQELGNRGLFIGSFVDQELLHSFFI